LGGFQVVALLFGLELLGLLASGFKGAVALGGSAGGGGELTPFGHQVVEQYRAIEGKAHNAVAGELPALAAATARSDR
jgi:hypothetical protein